MSADLQRVIRIVFEGDNETQRAFSEISKGLDTFEQGVRSVTGPLADAADKVLKLQAAMMALATGGIALSIKEAGNFNDSFNEISTLINATEPELQAFKEEFKDYARVTKFSLEDMSTAVYEAISRYTDYTDSLSFVATAEKLAIAGKSDLTSATVLLASTLAAYGEEVDQAGRYSDVFFTIVKEGGTTLPQIAESLAKLTAIAGPSGISIEELGAGLATLTAQGMPTSEAMTALRGIIQAIISPTSEAAEAADQLGIDFSLAGVQAKGLDGFLLDIYERTGGNVEEMAKLFTNVRGLTGVLAAFGQDGGDLFLEKLKAMEDASGSTTEAYEKMADNFALINQQLINNIKMTLVEIGEPLLAGYGELVESLIGLFQGVSIGISDDAFKPLFDMLNGVMNDLAKYIQQIAEALPEAMKGIDWTGLTKSMEEFKNTIIGVFQAIFQGLDPRDPEELKEILQSLIRIIEQLTTLSSKIVQEWQPVIRTISEITTEFGKLDDQTTESIGKMLGWSQKMETLWDTFGFLKGTLVALAIASEMSGAEIIWWFEKILGVGKVTFGGLKSVLLEIMGVIADVAYATAILFDVITLGKIDTFGQARLDLEDLIVSIKVAKGEARDTAAHGFALLSGSVRDTGVEAKTATSELSKLVGEVVALPDGKEVTITMGDLAAFKLHMDQIGQDLDGLTQEQLIALYLEVDAGSVATVGRSLFELSMGIETPVTAEADGASFNFVDQMLQDFGEERNPKVDPDTEPLKVKADEVDERMKFEASLDKTQAQTEMERIKADAAIIQTEMEWQAKIDIAEIEAKASIIRDAIEWKAKLDIAEVEANAAIMVSLAESVGAAWLATGESLASAYQAYADAEHSARSQISTWINEELRLRRELLELQQEMFYVQRDYMVAKTDALSRGDGMIQIDGAGLQPHLEAFMWEILSAIQVRVNEEGMSMLLGMEDLA